MTIEEKTESPAADLYATRDFESFWRIYRDLHGDPRTRALHAVATGSAIALVGFGLLARRVGPILAAPLVDHAIAQASHRLIEHNRTTPLRRPLWHLRAELRLFRGTCAAGAKRGYGLVRTLVH
jgi:hypothetical protein